MIVKKKFEIMVPEISVLEKLPYAYEPKFKMPPNYIKFKESVYPESYHDFSFDEVNYEIAEKDV